MFRYGFSSNGFYFVYQGVAMPAMNNLLSKWIPVSERSRSLALVYSGMYLGSVTGLAVSPALIHKFGWPSVFYSFGSLGSIWFALWLSKVRLHFFLLLFYDEDECFHNHKEDKPQTGYINISPPTPAYTLESI